MLEIRGIWLCHMSRWDRYVLRPWIWVETPRSGIVPHIGPYTAPSHFLRQATVVKNTRRPRQRHIIARRTEYAIKAQRFYLSDLFPDEEKTSYSHRESTSEHIMRVLGD